MEYSNRITIKINTHYKLSIEFLSNRQRVGYPEETKSIRKLFLLKLNTAIINKSFRIATFIIIILLLDVLITNQIAYSYKYLLTLFLSVNKTIGADSILQLL